MFKFITRLFKKKAATAADTIVDNPYELPSDNPGVNPVVVEDESAVEHEDVATLNSRLLMRFDENAGVSVRTRALVEMKNGFSDLAAHVRSLGQRLHAQTLGQSKLIETLSNLPSMLRELIPNGEEQTRALAALKMALDEQADANRVFVDALRPLPEFIQSVAIIPQAAQQQMQALTELTRQLERNSAADQVKSDEIKVMVETMAATTGENAKQSREVAETLQKYQKAQLKGVALQLKSSELGRKSMRRYHQDVARRQSAQFGTFQRDNARNFTRLEEHLARAQRRGTVVAACAVGLGIAGLIFSALVAGGVIRMAQPPQPAPVAESTRGGLGGTSVSK